MFQHNTSFFFVASSCSLITIFKAHRRTKVRRTTLQQLGRSRGACKCRISLTNLNRNKQEVSECQKNKVSFLDLRNYSTHWTSLFAVSGHFSHPNLNYYQSSNNNVSLSFVNTSDITLSVLCAFVCIREEEWKTVSGHKPKRRSRAALTTWFFCDRVCGDILCVCVCVRFTSFEWESRANTFLNLWD